jgi:hypothetical protein
MLDFTPQNLADNLDALVAATLETDREVAAVLTKCREGLRAISWERFRLRHEESSRLRVAARRRSAFIARQECGAREQGGTLWLRRDSALQDVRLASVPVDAQVYILLLSSLRSAIAVF